ncbi:MAG: cation diffusion facilitator family transporter [Eggerthellaceae bacterium]|jgi:cation diffusion facilitator family transporter
MADTNKEENLNRGTSLDKEEVFSEVQSRNSQIFRAAIVGIVTNLALAAAKAVFGFLSNSIAIILDAVNNLSDAASSIITVIGTRLAAKPADREHPFGHGRIEYITTFIIAVIVLWAGISALQEAIDRIINPQFATYDTLTLVIVVIAVITKIFLGLYTRRVGKKAKSDALVASGIDALMDSIISAATLAAALIYIFTGLALEAWLGAIIALFVIKAGIDILRGILSRLIGERVDSDLARSIKETVCSVDGVNGAYDLILDDFGPERLWGSVHVEVDDVTDAVQIDSITREIQRAVFNKESVFLHTVGIYPTNTSSELARKVHASLMKLVDADACILGTHGFYLDEETKHVMFDIIISFEQPQPKAVVARIKEELEKQYPGYSFSITIDADISD